MATINIHPVLLWVWLQLVIIQRVLIMPPLTFPLLSIRRRQRRSKKVCNYCGDGILGYGDDEVRVSHVWEEGEN